MIRKRIYIKNREEYRMKFKENRFKIMNNLENFDLIKNYSYGGEEAKGIMFNIEKGRTLNIIIDFRANLQIITEITPWNVVFQYVDFN